MPENKIKSSNDIDLAEHFGVEIDEIIPKGKQRVFFNSIGDAFTNLKNRVPQSVQNIFPTLRKLMEKNINILIVGGSGSGKSETITALLKDAKINNQEAKSKSGWSSETMDISAYQIEKCTIYDSPGLGDSDLTKDKAHKEKLIDILKKRDKDGYLLIDLVIVLFNATSRQVQAEYTLINEVILPNIYSSKLKKLVLL